MFQIIQNRKIWLSISSVLVVFSIVALAMFQLNFGIDFTGGSLLEVEFNEKRPDVNEVKLALADLELGSLIPQPIGEKGMILRFQDTSQEKYLLTLQVLEDLATSEKYETEDLTEGKPVENVEEGAANEGELPEIDVVATGSGDVAVELVEDKKSPTLTGLEELRFDSVGPTIGQELKEKSVTAIIVVLIAIVLYIAWAFRKVSKPVASWKYGLTATIALFHDVIITMGVFAVLGELYNIEVNTAFVAAILTVLGYSVNDTIVVFDRVRENLPKSDEDFEGTVNTSVNQTIKRSINTSLTTLLVLLSVLFFGGATIKGFILTLSIGVFIGTYSSIFLASPVLVVWEKLRRS